jgi:hypothetical protein
MANSNPSNQRSAVVVVGGMGDVDDDDEAPSTMPTTLERHQRDSNAVMSVRSDAGESVVVDVEEDDGIPEVGNVVVM